MADLLTDSYAEIERDRWGRPLILQPDGSKMAYTRASTLAKTLDDATNLTKWKARSVAVGMARSPHLVAEVSGLNATSDDPVEDHKKNLNLIADKAAEAAGGSVAASRGNALHSYMDAWNKGRKVAPVAEWAGHFTAYVEAIASIGVQIVASELFVVNDTLQAAGTADLVLRLPDGRVVIGDLKTGMWDATFPLPVATQEAIYANSQLYDPATGERSPIHPDLDPTLGVLMHLPAKVSPPACTPYALDLRVGLLAATMATQVRRIRNVKPISAWGA